jgi:hypothetical protein
VTVLHVLQAKCTRFWNCETSSPVARRSKVPAWPIFLLLKATLSLEQTSWEVQFIGLSTRKAQLFHNGLSLSGMDDG